GTWHPRPGGPARGDGTSYGPAWWPAPSALAADRGVRAVLHLGGLVLDDVVDRRADERRRDDDDRRDQRPLQRRRPALPRPLQDVAHPAQHGALGALHRV